MWGFLFFSGVAKLVSRLLWEQETVGSSPATATWLLSWVEHVSGSLRKTGSTPEQPILTDGVTGNTSGFGPEEYRFEPCSVNCSMV